MILNMQKVYHYRMNLCGSRGKAAFLRCQIA